MSQIVDTYLTIEKPSTGVFKDKGSKFLAFAYPVFSESETKDLIAHLKKEYFDARHHCFAYMIGVDKGNYRAFDDGEPSGTAGKPILGQIQSKGLTNILVVVVRYFGGTLLGTSGLIHAYKNATIDAIANAHIIEQVVHDILHVTFEYSAMNDVMKIIKDENLEIKKQQFDLNCFIDISIRQLVTNKISQKLDNIETVKYSKIE